MNNKLIEKFAEGFFNAFYSGCWDDKIIAKAKASEIMGGLLNSLRWLIEKLTKRGEILRAGSFVIPGSPVELINICKDTKLTIFIEKVGKAFAYFKS